MKLDSAKIFLAKNRRRIFLVVGVVAVVFTQVVIIKAFRQQHSRILVQQSTSVMGHPERAPAAERFAREAASLSPYDGYAWFYYGTSKYMQNQFAEAVPILTHAVQYLPHSYNAIRLLAFSSYQLQDFATAAEEFTRYLTMMPSPAVSPDLIFSRAGLAKLRQGDLDDATYYLMQATAASENKQDSLRGRIMAAVLSNRLGTAAYCTELFRHFEPDKQLNPFDLLAAALQTGKLEHAMVYLESIHDDSTEDISVLKALAAAYTRVNRQDEAKNLISGALAENADDASLHLAMGDLLYAEEKYAEAMVYYDEHLRLQPNSNMRQDIEQKRAAAARTN